MKLSIIIVNYNVKYFLQHSLHAASIAIADMSAEIIVVDNSSQDGSLNFLRPKFPQVIFIESRENLGFAKANNLALKQAKGEHVLFLNPDTLISKACIEECLAFFSKQPNAGVIGVQMIDGRGEFLPESKRAFPSPAVSFYKLFGLTKMFPQSTIFGKYALGFLDKNKVHEVDVLCGAFMMMKISVAISCKGFDERYFMYGEDIDLSFSVQEIGLLNYYLGNARIIHFKGESTKKGSVKQVKIFYNAMLLFVEKHYKNSFGILYSALLKMAIVGRASLSALKQPFISRSKKTENGKVLFSKIILVGDKTSVERAKHIWLKNIPTAEMIFSPIALSTFNQTKETAVVFCIGNDFSYEEAIIVVHKNAPLQNLFWFYEDAESLIGSGCKAKSGEFII